MSKSMDITRYIIIQAVQTEENGLIPIWDPRVILEESDRYGNYIRLSNDKINGFIKYINLFECVYDLKTKELQPGIELNIYPQDMKFKIKERVFYEKKAKYLIEATITDIKFEEYTAHIQRGKNVNINKINGKDIIIDKKGVYVIKYWKPTYILDNKIITEEDNLYHKG